MGISYKIAENLALETLNQLESQGYRGVSIKKLINTIAEARINPGSMKMQFKLPKNEQTIRRPTEENCWFLPRRVLLNTKTAYQPNELTRMFKDLEAAYFSTKTRGFDSSYVCRRARENTGIATIMQDSFNKSNPYSLMGTIGRYYETDAEGRRPHDANGDMYIRTPILIIPGTTLEDRAILNKFCKRFEIPNETMQKIILGEIDHI